MSTDTEIWAPPATSHRMLPTRAFGTTNMRITRVGFGAWAIGGGGWEFAWGDQDDNASIDAIRHAVSKGVNWIDTAAVYGLGHSEGIVARALRDVPRNERPYVFTKCGLVWDERNRSVPPRRVGNPKSIRRECEASLRRLGIERIDLYQMHWPAEDGTPIEDYWATLLELKREGKARAVGLSNHSAEQLAAAERIGHVDTLQPPFSAIHRGAAARELPWCAAHKTGVIVYSSMQSGLLTGAFTAQRAARLSAGDWRSRSPDFTGERPRPRGRPEADRAAARHDSGRRRRGVDLGVAGRHGGDRRRAVGRPGRRMDRCRITCTEPLRSRRDRRRDRDYERGRGARTAMNLNGALIERQDDRRGVRL